MSRNELVAKIEALNEWEAVIEEAKAEADALRDAIKAEMMERDTEELTAGQYIVRWTSVISNRFDTTAFKKFSVQQVKNFVQIPGYPVVACQFFHVSFSPVLDFWERASYNVLALSLTVWVWPLACGFGRRIRQGPFLMR